jgi:hypothetical protein
VIQGVVAYFDIPKATAVKVMVEQVELRQDGQDTRAEDKIFTALFGMVGKSLDGKLPFPAQVSAPSSSWLSTMGPSKVETEQQAIECTSR